MLRVFIGYDKAEIAAYQVCSYSIIKNCSQPVSITPLNIRQLPWLTNTDYKASTEFAFSRFAVPHLCDFEGQALFMDCDMLVTGDVTNLFAEARTTTSVNVVQHQYKPSMEDKFLGQQQTNYEKKNWSSVMLFNNENCKQLTPNYLNKANGPALHQFEWADRVGKLSPMWNYLVGEETEHGKLADPHIIHYTRGGPYFKEYAQCEHADLWWKYHAEANSVLDRRVVNV